MYNLLVIKIIMGKSVNSTVNSAGKSKRIRSKGIKAIPPSSNNEAVKYQQSGLQGEAKSTICAVNSAIGWFNLFLKSKKLKKAHEISEELLCNAILFREYATYLINMVDKHYISQGSAVQYLSGARTSAMARFPDHRCWNEELSGGWYKRLRKSTKDIMKRINVQRGEINCFKAYPIGRTMLIKIGAGLLAKNTTDAVVKRCKLMMTFFAAGRSGELANTKWTDTSWDVDDEIFQFQWNEKKTLQAKIVPVYHDNCSLNICFYHSLACYLIVGGSGIRSQMEPISEEYIFPDMKISGTM